MSVALMTGVIWHMGCITAMAAEVQLTAIPTTSEIVVDGLAIPFDAYNIEGNNYFKLRDIAFCLNGTAKQFEVGWDVESNTIILTSGRPYTIVGGEMMEKATDEKIALPMAALILLDGHNVTFTAYNIDGSHYFKLRDIGRTLDFGVVWDEAARTVIINTASRYNEGPAYIPSFVRDGIITSVPENPNPPHAVYPAPTDMNYTPDYKLADEIAAEINAYRHSLGLPVLTVNHSLAYMPWNEEEAMWFPDSEPLNLSRATKYGNLVWCLENGKLAHYTRTPNGVSENLFSGSGSAKDILQAWINSPGHDSQQRRSDHMELGVLVLNTSGRTYVSALFIDDYSINRTLGLP